MTRQRIVIDLYDHSDNAELLDVLDSLDRLGFSHDPRLERDAGSGWRTIDRREVAAFADQPADGTCGHKASGNGFAYTCDLPVGHKGWHEERTQLRDSTERTNWGDDGLAMHASTDEARRAGR